MDETTDDDSGISNIRAQAAELQDEIGELQDRLADAPKRVRTLEDRLTTQKSQLAKAVSQNEKLVLALQEARQQIGQLRDEVDKLTKPPSGYGTMLGENTDGSVDVYSSGRKLRVEVHPDLAKTIRRGQEVVLNEAMNVILARGGTSTGEVAVLREVMADGRRATISTRGDETKVCTLAEHLVGANLRGGETVLIEPRANVVLERVPKPEAEQLVLEEVPDVSYADVGGLEVQIEAITDAVELPFLHSELFAEYDLPAPKGILLYGPPGCGKTLIAKAVANSLATKVAAASGGGPTKSYFFNIKGPELLNKYVGETERQIRAVFERAREKAAEGWPVIVFFDEMESLFRTRGTGISSDMESTIVPQLLAEIDGVEALNNVIVIGASNREDLIDPAILRPGRLDVKIKIERPNTEAATAIFGRYLTTLTPIGPTAVETVGGGDIDKAIQGMIEQTVADMYAAEEQNQFLEVTYQNGDKEIMYFRDFSSGAMIENIVRRAKKLAIKRELAGGTRGVVLDDLIASVHQEFKEHEDLPNTTNPDDWARISGKKGERIVFVRTLMTQDTDPHGGKAIEGVGTGQYL